jgi:hypothetical protein
MKLAMSPAGPSRQAAFFGATVANGALRTWLDLQLAPLSRLMDPTATSLAIQPLVLRRTAVW